MIDRIQSIAKKLEPYLERERRIPIAFEKVAQYANPMLAKLERFIDVADMAHERAEDLSGILSGLSGFLGGKK